LDFDTKEQEAILLKVALSPVSMKNALANMEAEAPDWNFDGYVKQGQNALGKGVA
jgi:putative alpha-1,2-mannosidase